MNFRIRHVVAALFAAGAVTAAWAQNAPAQPAQPTPLEAPTVTFVSEPVASTTAAPNANSAVLDAIAQALNAEPGLKNSKITVQPHDNGILLTGSVATAAQMAKASKIASSHAGGATVINTIAPDEVVIDLAGRVPAELEVVEAKEASEPSRA